MPEEDLPDWVRQLRNLQKEAERWAGHPLGEDGWHDEEECRVCLEGKAVVNACRCGRCPTGSASVGDHHRVDRAR